MIGQQRIQTSAAAIRPRVATSHARPDIVDRHGRLLATDVAVPSLFADPARVLDADDVVARLKPLISGVDGPELANVLSDKKRRFAWIKRQMPPSLAQTVHNLGLPGLSFREEISRVYPRAQLAGHILGAVDVDNKGLAGFESYIDRRGWVRQVYGVSRSERAPIQMSLDLAVQQALTVELGDAIERYKARAAAGIVLDVKTGEVLAATSRSGGRRDAGGSVDLAANRDRVISSTYELGSIFKLFTVAMALDAGRVTPTTKIDVRAPLRVGGHTIRDLHPAGRPLTVAEVFLRSSNIGSGALALEVGKEEQKAFLSRLGLTEEMMTEAGRVARVQLPKSWGEAETATISYGHGIAVAPLQFASAAAALVNGGRFVRPTFLRQEKADYLKGAPIIKRSTSRQIRNLMRRNVGGRFGTGRRADVLGYRVGGKTGTAELPARGGYNKNSVISSFVAAFPMDAPAYLTLVMLFEPQPVAETNGSITAGYNAAPATGRLIKRIAPLIGVAARR